MQVIEETPSTLVPSVIEELQLQRDGLCEVANEFHVTDTTSAEKAGEYRSIIGDLIKEAKSKLDPVCDAANKAHKAATGARKEMLAPMESADKHLVTELASYENQRLEAQREAEREAIRKAEEEAQAKQAALVEEKLDSGDLDGALAVEEAPAPIEPVVVPQQAPKIKSSGFRTDYGFKIIDPLKVPREYLTIDEKKIRGVVRALKDATNIPGVVVTKTQIPIRK